jgi:Cof subfamily protein (haloacid dehalogenase superfamily)
MMIKLIVSDMDGSILQPDLSISKRTIDAVRKAQQQGVIFTFATGRPDQLMKEYVDLISLQEPIISSNGSVIGNPFQLERIYEQGLDKETVNKALTYLEDHHISYMIYTKDGILCQENKRSRFFEDRNQSLPEKQRSTFIYHDHPASLLTNQIVNKILVIEYDPIRYQEIYQVLKALDHVHIIQSQNHFIDINPIGVNKGDALERLANYYGIDIKETVAFGDHHNDIELMERAGIGVAMGNAVPEVKDAADDITDTNERDGVAKWIEEHILQ